MFKIMAFLSKREDIETRAFIEYYEQHHVPLIRSLAPTPIGYRRNYLLRGDELNIEDDSIDFDVVTELTFPIAPPISSGRPSSRDRRPASRSSRKTRRGSWIGREPGPTSSRNASRRREHWRRSRAWA